LFSIVARSTTNVGRVVFDVASELRSLVKTRPISGAPLGVGDGEGEGDDTGAGAPAASARALHAANTPAAHAARNARARERDDMTDNQPLREVDEWVNLARPIS
jgi:hypothetical protein